MPATTVFIPWSFSLAVLVACVSVCGLEIFFHPARMSLFLRPVFPFIPLPAPIEPNPAAKVLAT